MIKTCIHLFNKLCGTSIFRTILGKANWSELPRRFKNSRVNIKSLTGDGRLNLVRIIGNQGFKKGEGVSVRTEATNYKSIGLTLTLRQLTIKRIILEKVIQVCFLLFYCNTEPLQGFFSRSSDDRSWWKVSLALVAKKCSRECDQRVCFFLLNVLLFHFLVSVVVVAVA